MTAVTVTVFWSLKELPYACYKSTDRATIGYRDTFANHCHRNQSSLYYRHFIIFTGAPRDIQRPSKIQLDAELVAVAPSRVDRDQVGSGEDQSVGGRKAALHHLGSGRLKRVTYAQ